MNDFLSWCMHLIVPFHFDVTSLHPPSFHRNDFSTCDTYFANHYNKPCRVAFKYWGAVALCLAVLVGTMRCA